MLSSHSAYEWKIVAIIKNKFRIALIIEFFFFPPHGFFFCTFAAAYLDGVVIGLDAFLFLLLTAKPEVVSGDVT